MEHTPVRKKPGLRPRIEGVMEAVQAAQGCEGDREGSHP